MAFSSSRVELRRKRHDNIATRIKTHWKCSKTNIDPPPPIEEKHQQAIEMYLFHKLEIYASKSRLWQVTHSSHIKRRLMEKSAHLATLHQIPDHLVVNAIENFFGRIERSTSKLIQLIEHLSTTPSSKRTLFEYKRNQKNQWRSIQLQRARTLFPHLNNDDDDDDLLDVYRQHVSDTFTPIRSTPTDRQAIFDLDHAYEQAQSTGASYLQTMLDQFHSYDKPDMALIEEMVRHGE
jgi:hypothetical protein